MALEFLKENMKKKGIIARLDNYLLTLQKEDNDRAFNVNAPSQIAVCKRARYYSRTGKAQRLPIVLEHNEFLIMERTSMNVLKSIC